MAAYYVITFQPSGRRCIGTEADTILDIARRNGVDILAACGGQGSCGKCKVRVAPGKHQPWRLENQKPFMNEYTRLEKKVLRAYELSRGCRLACQVKVWEDAVVYIPQESTQGAQVILSIGQAAKVPLKPNLHFYVLHLQGPSLADFRSDSQRIMDGLREDFPETFAGSSLTMDISLLRSLPGIVRKLGWKMRVGVMGGRKIVSVQDVSLPPRGYGVAVDVGTTTLAAMLVDLTTGRLCCRRSRMNAQVRYGDDVISRISYTVQEPQGLQQLQKLILEDCSQMMQELAEKAGIQQQDIFEIVFAGNTVMEHILLGIEPKFIGKSPFAAALHAAVDLPPQALGLQIAPAGNLHFLPLEAGFVGADNAAVLIAGETYKHPEMTLTVDIGTNGEIAFGNDELMYVTSCATGPALEGAQLTFGMRASAGAIEKVNIKDGSFRAVCRVIGGGKPCGICGSGILDAAAEMVRTGILKVSGSFNKQLASPRIRKNTSTGQWEYLLVPAAETGIHDDIVITQKDVRAVQLAKAALYAGAALLVEKSGGQAIERVVLAGAFGSYIDKHNALAIGLLPSLSADRIEVVGNAAGEGARLALINLDKRREAEWIAERVRFVEAAADTSFQKYFMKGMDLVGRKIPEEE